MTRDLIENVDKEKYYFEMLIVSGLI